MRIGIATTVATAIVIGTLIASTGGGAAACAWPNFPTAACTGVPDGTSLTTHSGDFTTTSNGQTINAMDITGCLIVNHHSVHVTNSEMQCVTTADSQAETLTNPPLVIEDSTIDCEFGQGSSGVSEQNIELYRVEIKRCENGLNIDESLVVEDSLIWMHRQCQTSDCVEPDAHTDGLQTPIGNDLRIVHNTIRAYNDFAWNGGAYTCPSFQDGRCNGTSALNIKNNASAGADNVLIDKNLLGGGASTIYCSTDAVNNFVITNNHFEDDTAAFTYGDSCSDETQSGNVEHTSGDPVTLG